MTVTPIIPQTTPRSLEVLTGYLRAEMPCPHCDASPGTSCKWQGRRSVHLGRWVRAYATHKITPRELETLAGLLPDPFTNATIIRAGARAEAIGAVNALPVPASITPIRKEARTA